MSFSETGQALPNPAISAHQLPAAFCCQWEENWPSHSCNLATAATGTCRLLQSIWKQLLTCHQCPMVLSLLTCNAPSVPCCSLGETKRNVPLCHWIALGGATDGSSLRTQRRRGTMTGRGTPTTSPQPAEPLMGLLPRLSQGATSPQSMPTSLWGHTGHMQGRHVFCLQWRARLMRVRVSVYGTTCWAQVPWAMAAWPSPAMALFHCNTEPTVLSQPQTPEPPPQAPAPPKSCSQAGPTRAAALTCCALTVPKF